MTTWRIAILFVLGVACEFHAQSQEPCRYLTLTIVSFTVDDSSYRSDARTTCHDEYMNPYRGVFQARNYVVDETSTTVVGESVCSTCPKSSGETVWVGAVSGASTIGHCYRNRLQASSTFYSQAIGSAQRCTTGGTAATPEICEIRPWRCDPRYFEECPILIRTENGKWDLTSTDDGVSFDLNSDGKLDRTAWTSAGSGLAFLAIDLDEDGAIEDARELFGSHIGLPHVDVVNGFDALSHFDSNADDVIDVSDPIWRSLLLWNDSNHDGRSQANELAPLHGSGIASLEVNYSESHRRDPHGNVLRYGSLLRRASGAVEKYYDVYFKARPLD